MHAAPERETPPTRSRGAEALRLSEIRGALREFGMHAARSMGQNFLHDRNLARWIVERADVTPGDRVVEIGPGFGSLTEWLVARGARVLAIEKDRRLANWLRERFGSAGVDVVEGDALRHDLRPLFAEGAIRLVANLPYSVSSQLLCHWMGEPTPIASAVVTLQREMADRLVAAPGTQEYGIFTLLLGRRWRTESLRILPPSVFHPAPKVGSAVVRLTRRTLAARDACDEALWLRLIRQGFAQRRKQLGNALARENLDWTAVESQVGISRTMRAEEVDPARWVALARFLGRDAPPGDFVPGDDPLEIVDEHDQPVRCAPRPEAHARALRHRSVHIFVLNTQGAEIFLQKRASWKDCHPGAWDSSAAGHLAPGESYGDGARRELREELGIDVEPEQVATIAAEERTGWEFVRLYRVLHDGPVRIAPAEIDCGAFFPIDLVERWATARPSDFTPGFLVCLDRVRQFKTR